MCQTKDGIGPKIGGMALVLNRLQRSDWTISREYKSKLNDCKGCSLRNKCLAPSQKRRKIMVNIFDAAMRLSRVKDGSHEHKMVLTLRQIWCEGTVRGAEGKAQLETRTSSWT